MCSVYFKVFAVIYGIDFKPIVAHIDSESTHSNKWMEICGTIDGLAFGSLSGVCTGMKLSGSMRGMQTGNLINPAFLN